MREHFIYQKGTDGTVLKGGSFEAKGRCTHQGTVTERTGRGTAGQGPQCIHPSIRLPNCSRGSVLEKKRGKRGMVTLFAKFIRVTFSILLAKSNTTNNHVLHHSQSQVDPSTSSLGSENGAGPSTDSITQLIVRENLFWWSRDIKIKTRGGTPFGNGLKIRGKDFSVAHGQMVLVDGNNMPVAVCWRNSTLFGQTFKIYSTQPLYHGQKPSDRKYNQYDFYTHAKVERVPLFNMQQVTFDNESSPSYTIHRARGLGSKAHIVKLHGRPAALMEGGLREQGTSIGTHTCLQSIQALIHASLCVCLLFATRWMEKIEYIM